MSPAEIIGQEQQRIDAQNKLRFERELKIHQWIEEAKVLPELHPDGGGGLNTVYICNGQRFRDDSRCDLLGNCPGGRPTEQFFARLALAVASLTEDQIAFQRGQREIERARRSMASDRSYIAPIRKADRMIADTGLT